MTEEHPINALYRKPQRRKTFYTPENALDDIESMKYAEALFLNSRMVESEEYCLEVDPNKERLYITAGYSLIQCLKALMSYEDQDLREALDQTAEGNALAGRHRGAEVPLSTRLASLIWQSSAVQMIKAMTPVQRHAELLYAETLFAKALLGVVCSGSWLAFIKEALSFKAMITIYMNLGKYLDTVDAEAAARGEGPEDESIDQDFRSGVDLGVGASNMILSLMPSRVVSFAELFGYQGNREVGLARLMKVGGWEKGMTEPKIGIEEQGLRRSLADIALLCFHLVLSNYTIRGVDIHLAQDMLDWNLKQYPNGVFFLFGEGRLRLLHSQPALAVESYKRAMDVQSEYRNLHYISYWEMAFAYLALWDVQESLSCWRVLEAEATWSKACYLYGAAVSLLELGERDGIEEASRLLARIPSVVHRIAGKSIPIEKYVARKARKFEKQGALTLPALEFAYLFSVISHTPSDIIMAKMLPDIDSVLVPISAAEKSPSSYRPRFAQGKSASNDQHRQQYYWDDYCLAHLLKGVCLRYAAYPDPDAIIPNDVPKVDISAVAESALQALGEVLKHGSKIELDHYILYNAHYEIGRLYICMGDKANGREHLDIVLSGKSLEPVGKARKGKYSLQSELVMHATAAIEALNYED